MRRIGPVAATLVVAIWLFMIGFIIGFEGALASDVALTPAHTHPFVVGLTGGVLALAIGALCAGAVWLARTRMKSQRLREPQVAA